jgi:hypothetical protein
VDGHQKAGAQLQRKGFDSLAFLVVMERKKSTCSRESRTSTSGSEGKLEGELELASSELAPPVGVDCDF